MSERGHPKDAAVEMPEYGPLLEDEDEDVQHPGFQQRAPKRRRLTEWLLWGVLILSCLVLLFDNIRLRGRQISESAFATDLSKLPLTRRMKFSVDAKVLAIIQLLRNIYLS